MIVYNVMHNMGMDGNYSVATFSKKEDAEKLRDLYNQTDDCGDYDFYYVDDCEVDKYKVEDYSVVEDEGWKSLRYKNDYV